MLKISKIAHGESTAITCENTDEQSSTTFRCEQDPHPDFHLAYRAQKNVVSDLLPFDLGQDDFEITSIGYTADDKKKEIEFHIAFVCDGLNAAASVKLPKIRRYRPEGNTSSKKTLEDIENANEWFEKLVQEAREYLKGKRAQGELFDQASDEDSEDEDEQEGEQE